MSGSIVTTYHLSCENMPPISQFSFFFYGKKSGNVFLFIFLFFWDFKVCAYTEK